MEKGNQMQHHKIETNSEVIYEDGSIWSTLIFFQNYRQLYTVIPITTVRGPFIAANICLGGGGVCISLWWGGGGWGRRLRKSTKKANL